MLTVKIVSEKDQRVGHGQHQSEKETSLRVKKGLKIQYVGFFPQQKSALAKKVCLKIFMKIILVVPGLSRGDDQNLGQNLRQ